MDSFCLFLMVVRQLPWPPDIKSTSNGGVKSGKVMPATCRMCSFYQGSKTFPRSTEQTYISWPELCHRATSIRETGKVRFLPLLASVVEADKRERDGDGCWVRQYFVSVIMNFIKVFVG